MFFLKDIIFPCSLPVEFFGQEVMRNLLNVGTDISKNRTEVVDVLNIPSSACFSDELVA